MSEATDNPFDDIGDDQTVSAAEGDGDTNETIKLCDEGTWAEMKAGCNVFRPSLVSNPGWFASIFSDQTPEIGLNAALVGQPEN